MEQNFIQSLKHKINIVDVVGEFVRLKKAGTNYSGLCPFHAECTPSFTVSEKKQIYHCFGCQRGGDVISFVQESQVVSFAEALRILSSKIGIALPKEFQSARGGQGPQKEEENELLFKLNRFVAQFYQQKLWAPEGKAAREYLLSRGLTEDFMRKAYLGYAPAGWAELHDFLLDKKAPIEKAEILGLVRKRSTAGSAESHGRDHYDLFRDRAMFPVVNGRGQVVAFGGRSLAQGTEDGPKYLNSSESPIFHKGNGVYGLFLAQKEIRAEDCCVLVEGYMDCLALQQAGIGYTVASLGTALTEKQVGLLKRFTRNVVVIFDGDRAGQEAQQRAMELFLKADLVVRGIKLPQGLDPDDYVKNHGAEKFKEEIKRAPFLLDSAILDLATEAAGRAEMKAQALEKIVPWLAEISADTARLVRIQEVATLFGTTFELLEKRVKENLVRKPGFQAKNDVSYRSLNTAVNNASFNPRNNGNKTFSKKAFPVFPKSAHPTSQIKPMDSLDVRFLEVVISLTASTELMQKLRAARFVEMKEAVLNGLHSETIRRLTEKIYETFSSESGTTEEIGNILDWPEVKENAQLRVMLTQALVKEEVSAKYAGTSGENVDDKQVELLSKEFDDLVDKLSKRALEKRRDLLRTVILKADSAGQSEEFLRLMSEYNELVRKL